ncbi:Glycosyl transferase family 2 [Quadrisphaera granulorum]|uniref:Glycosyl transferase family 2 n=1 Tax=Quadrisphaera granulorum TaxID=317664 RepID=A0A316AE67_9ACTN|nr:glycosyltransferase [Quadrisphaera granulorum]PWJ56076.1 glycosyl transferase family 2 [Quadrisphaera granulorum]SZE94710.1 Glycosyl transferase family 2 [Quadrisphaera granulorum]
MSALTDATRTGAPTPEPTGAQVPALPAVEVTVLVPARDELGSIERCLDSILAQQGVDFEIVVVDNGSTDGTAELLAARADRDPRIVVVHQPEPSIPLSLNAGLARARGRWLVRVDAHSTISDGYLAHAAKRLREGRWAAVGGRKTAVARTSRGRAVAAVLNSKLAVGGSTYHWGTEEQVVDHVPFGCYPTELVRQLGGWDTEIANNEDFEFDQRLRREGEILFDPALTIDWDSRESVGALYRQYRRYGSGKPGVAVRHPRSLRLRHLAPPLLVVYLVGAAVVGLRRPGVALAAVVPYAIGVTAVGARIGRSAPPGADRAAIPLALAAMQVGWGVGFWRGATALLRRAGSRRNA